MEPTISLLSDKGLLAAVSATTVGVVITDVFLPDNPIIYANPAFEAMTGYRSDQIIGHNCRFLQGPETCQKTLETLRESIAAGCNSTCRLLNYRQDGTTFWNELTISPVHGDADQLLGFVGFQHDVTAEVKLRRRLDEKVKALQATRRSLKASNTELRKIAYIDKLTGLPTRRVFESRLNQAIARSKRTEEPLAIAFIDLDGFKQVNDQFGHDIGDLALCHIAERMQDAIRETDTLARLGGDEFVLLVDTLVTDEAVRQIADRLREIFATPLDLGRATVQLGVSIGTAHHPDNGTDADSLMRFADTAMYGAKHANRAPQNAAKTA